MIIAHIFSATLGLKRSYYSKCKCFNILDNKCFYWINFFICASPSLSSNVFNAFLPFYIFIKQQLHQTWLTYFHIYRTVFLFSSNYHLPAFRKLFVQIYSETSLFEVEFPWFWWLLTVCEFMICEDPWLHCQYMWQVP